MTPSITDTQIITALGDWLASVVPGGVAIIRGQANRVPEPRGTDYVVMTPLGRPPLATNLTTWDEVGSSPTVLSVETATQVRVQVDVHGPGSADNVQVIVGLWRDDNAAMALATSSLAPLTASDPLQLPFRNAENQYEDRWTVELALQANVTVTPAQDFADALAVGLELAD